MDRYTVETADRYDMEITPDGMWVMHDDAQAAIAAAVAEERERCAKVCDLHSRLTWNDDRKAQARVLADEIRREAQRQR